MHHTTPPTEQQAQRIAVAKVAADAYALAIDALIPAGKTKTIVMHKLRTISQVINEVITHT